MNKFYALVLAIVTSLALVAAPSAATPVPNLTCNGVVSSGTYKNVTVNAGDSCTLTGNVEVLGGVHAKPGAKNVIVKVEVGRNIQVNGATGTVYVGPKDICKVDPPVRNNVHVTNSHNVLICEVTSGNNINVTNNDGFVVVQDSDANNINVSRNSDYVPSPKAVKKFGIVKPASVRVVRNTADHNIHLFNNAPRKVIAHGNSPKAVVK